MSFNFAEARIAVLLCELPRDGDPPGVRCGGKFVAFCMCLKQKKNLFFKEKVGHNFFFVLALLQVVGIFPFHFVEK
jgi:hypothetical protein